MDEIMKDFYQKQLENDKKELDLIIDGVISKVDKILSDCLDKSVLEGLKLDDICLIADELNALLSTIQRKQKAVDASEKLVKDHSAEGDNEGL